MLFGHTCGWVVFMEDFKEKLLGLTNILRDPGMWVPLSFLLWDLICQVAALSRTLGQIGTGKVSGLGSVHSSD